MTLSAAPDAMQGAVAAGILGSGSVILGASETAGRLYLEVEKEAARHNGDLQAAARVVVADLRARKQAIAGYGHPEHKARDPRVGKLFEVRSEEHTSELQSLMRISYAVFCLKKKKKKHNKTIATSIIE